MRRLGTTDISISELGFGCMSLNADDAAGSNEMIQHALDAGVTFFDTADLYDQGRNEELVGAALRGHRQDVVIATKVGNRFVPGQSGWTWDPSPTHIRQAVESSLQRLQTDYIDLYQLHGGTMEDPFDEIVETMERLQERGLIRAYGISSIRPNVILRYLQSSNIASIMMQYSLLDRRPEEWYPHIRAAGVSVISRGPLARGLLTGDKHLDDNERYLNWAQADVDHVQSSVASVADVRGQTSARIAIGFSIYPDVIATSVPGASSLAQLDNNLGTASMLPLTSSEISALHDALPAQTYEVHRP